MPSNVLTRKPFWQLMLLNIRPFFREPATLFWTFGFPIFMALLLVQAFSGEKPMAEVNVVVIEQEKIDAEWYQAIEKDNKVSILNIEDAALIARINAHFAEPRSEVSPGEGLSSILSNHGDVLILTPSGLFSTRNSHEQAIAFSHVMALQDQARKPYLDGVIDLQGFRYIDWLIPGIIVLQIIGIGITSISNGLVSDRQQGFFKRLKLSPFSRLDYVIGIVFARVFLLIFQLVALFATFYFLFGYQPLGNWLSILTVLLLGSVVLCLIGVLVGARSQKVEVATGISNLLYFPLMFLSGIYFDTSNFPQTIQNIVQWLPSTAFLDAFRLTANQGASLADVSVQVQTLAGFTVVLLVMIYFLFDWGDEK
ncbi:ABC transporter permease [Pseudoalteromonas luteoviolacea]|uniref:ABC transporter permease n=1 Tax=Pseudoalteromonas luteoviolacea TaxID=43657 RepID=UPI001F40CF87|nr:ABC transporter permease [Pseudoalteromonas luteoviolacea]MCF6438732.1 ABC transporter permease [Pseudoalteromonas luteoviolacea]